MKKGKFQFYYRDIIEISERSK